MRELAEHFELLAVGAADAARMLGVSLRHWGSLDAAGRSPRGFRLGRRKLWRVADLEGWAAAGFPARDELERSPCNAATTPDHARRNGRFLPDRGRG